MAKVAAVFESDFVKGLAEGVCFWHFNEVSVVRRNERCGSDASKF